MHIRKTCPCNEYPLKPHFYIVKLGFAGVYLFFLFLLQNIDCEYKEIFKVVKYENFPLKNIDIFLIFAQNIDCGYSLEPPRRGGSNVYPQSMF